MSLQIAKTRRIVQKMSFEEYMQYAPDSRIAEWVEGEVTVHMPPIFDHQDIVGFLDGLLRLFVTQLKVGLVVPAPFAIKLWPNGPAREPDLIFISEANRDNLEEKLYQGGPDLLVEVISPGSVTLDRVRKFAEYEEAGVREYWIIDPRQHQQQVDFYILDEEGVYQPAPINEAGVYQSTVLPGFWLEIAWLWQRPLPNPQWALAAIMRHHPDLSEEIRGAYDTLFQSLRNED